MTVRINKQKINLREKLAETEEKVNFDEVVRGLGENTAPLILNKDGGNVGIGTVSPDGKLNIAGVTAGTSAFMISRVEDATIPLFNIFQDSSWQSGGEGQGDGIAHINTNNRNLAITTSSGASSLAGGIFIREMGNVGIGTTSPDRNLVIDAGANSSPLRLIARSSDEGCAIQIRNSANTDTVTQLGGNIDSYFTGGNVGIGTSDPSALLEINPGNIVTASDTQVGNLKFRNGSSGASNAAVIAGRTDVSGATNYTDRVGLALFTQGQERMRITSAGNVGIGTTNPVAKLDIYTTGASGWGLKVRTDNGDADSIKLVGGGGDTDVKFVVKGSGNVGIGTANPGKQLTIYNSIASAKQFQVESDHASSGWGGLSSFVQINGALSRSISVGAYRPEENVNPCALVQLQSRDGGTAFLWMDDSNVLRLGTNSGNVGSTSGTSLGTAGTSDERLKNIEDVFEYGLSHVLQLKPIAFTFKKDAQQVRKLGFGAQTSQSVVPESVYDSGNCIDGYDSHPEHEGMNVSKSDDNELGMEYVQLIPVLTKAIQEQQSIIEDLKSRIETLEQQ